MLDLDPVYPYVPFRTRAALNHAAKRNFGTKSGKQNIRCQFLGAGHPATVACPPSTPICTRSLRVRGVTLPQDCRLGACACVVRLPFGRSCVEEEHDKCEESSIKPFHFIHASSPGRMPFCFSGVAHSFGIAFQPRKSFRSTPRPLALAEAAALLPARLTCHFFRRAGAHSTIRADQARTSVIAPENS
jgi:hypothetical protein